MNVHSHPAPAGRRQAAGSQSPPGARTHAAEWGRERDYGVNPTIEARQRQILDAAATCFVRRGFHQSTMQEICRAAGLSPGSVYRYYPGKEAIIAALVERDCGENLAIIQGVRQRQEIARALHTLLDFAIGKIRDPALATLHIEVTAEALRNPAMAAIVNRSDGASLEAVEAMMGDAQRQGVMDRELDPHASAEILIALLEGLAVRRALNPELDLEGYAPAIKSLLNRFLQIGNAVTGGEESE
jgi:AcrR family transcriptional regulator